MTRILTKEAQQKTVTQFAEWLLTEAPAQQITKASNLIYPLSNVVVRKVKMLKKAKLDSTKLDDLYKEERVSEKKNKKTKGKDGKEDESTKNLVDA